MPRLRPLLYCLLAISLTVPAQATLTWRPGEGWSDDSAGSDTTASSSRDQLEVAHKLEAEGRRDDALKAYRSLLRRWPLSFFAPEAQFRVGKILEDEADFAGAFKAFQKMVEKYPSSDYFEQALGEQYRIANLYLAGEPQRIWKIPVGPSMDRTVEMYQRIIKNAPFGTYAPQCQFKIGLADEQERKYTDAVDAYQLVIDNYPTNSVAADAQYQIGYAWMHASIAGDYDLGAARKAVEAFQDFLVRYPDSDKAVQAQENIQKLGLRQTQGAFAIAKFYEASHPPQPRAAFIYYNEVIREDPNGAEAQVAKKRIQALKPVLDALPGGVGPDGTPLVAQQQTVASGPNAPLPTSDSNPGTPSPNAGPPDTTPGAGTLPTDPNAPVTSSSPGATAVGAAPATPVPSDNGGTPANSSTNAAPVTTPPDHTPLPQ
ncbi:MAG: tetratricopeptide repeat protein [Methylacidiphilales bacterium]|nr:tetratricopeptide repeat protein [Candidatus Methylacidiphilales bacterium]